MKKVGVLEDWGGEGGEGDLVEGHGQAVELGHQRGRLTQCLLTV